MPALVAATALVFAIACHAALRRIPKAPGAVAAFLIVGILIGGAVTTFLWLSPLAWDEFLAALIVYAALSALYLFLFTLALGSITANILVAVSDGPTDLTDLAARYDGHRMVSNRVDRLIAQKLIKAQGDILVPTERGTALMTHFQRLAAFFGHRRLA